MSSHHIIREDQEPALLIADADAAPLSVVQELLEWSPIVIILERALPQVLNWGIKIDVVVAEASRIPTLKEALNNQLPLKLISCQGEEDALSTALYYVLASKQKTVNVLSIRSLENFESFSTLELSVFQSGKRWSLIRSGVFEKWFPAGSEIHIVSQQLHELIKAEQDGMIVLKKENAFWVAEE